MWFVGKYEYDSFARSPFYVGSPFLCDGTQLQREGASQGKVDGASNEGIGVKWVFGFKRQTCRHSISLD